MRITVGNLKGGVGKTTTSWFLARLLADRGRTLLIDADPQSQSAFDWAEIVVAGGGVLPFDIQAWSTNDMPRRAALLVDQYDNVVIDTGGETAALFRGALRVTGRDADKHDGGYLVVPVAPDPIEVRRIPATFEAAAEVDAEGVPVYPSVLLTRVDTRAGDVTAARQFFGSHTPPLPVMSAHVREGVLYSRAFGTIPPIDSDYALVLAELSRLGAGEVSA